MRKQIHKDHDITYTVKIGCYSGVPTFAYPKAMLLPTCVRTYIVCTASLDGQRCILRNASQRVHHKRRGMAVARLPRQQAVDRPVGAAVTTVVVVVCLFVCLLFVVLVFAA